MMMAANQPTPSINLSKHAFEGLEQNVAGASEVPARALTGLGRAPFFLAAEDATMPGNQRTSLRLSKARRDNMADFDALPAPLRAWLAEARLPWSPASARRAWRRALWRSLGRTRAALAEMDRIEDRRLAQDALTREREGEGLAPPPLRGGQPSRKARLK
jgi:hypothetical protein